MNVKDQKDKKIKSPSGPLLSIKVKREALEAIDLGELTAREVMSQYGIKSRSTIDNWRLQVAQGPATFRRFSEVEKRRIVREYEAGLINKAQAMRAYGVRSRSTLNTWIAKYSLDSEIEPMSKAPQKFDSTQYNSPEQEIEALRKALEREKLKTLSLETLIEVAEENLNVKIVKKPGAKQSK